MRVLLEEHYSAYKLTPVNKRIARNLEDIIGEDSVLIQSDWDFPHLAQALGWDMRDTNCRHVSTDGTVECSECKKTSHEFITEAGEWLSDHCDRAFNLKDASSFSDLEEAANQRRVLQDRRRREFK